MALRPINGLALCAGIGGLDLALKLAIGDSYRTVAYVEREAYAAACLVARMEEGYLDSAPIWDDVTTFDGKPWRGVVDIVTAGFPCQPFSLAGKRLGEADKRHLWPEIARIIGECGPELVFLENVHISAFRQPFDDLQAMGFSLSPPYAATAAEMGAGHIRRRVFVLAYHVGSSLWNKSRWRSRQSGQGQAKPAEVHSQSPSQQVGTGRLSRQNCKGASWWESEPKLERLVHGVPHRVDRDRALGNAVVPAMAAKAFLALLERTEQ